MEEKSSEVPKSKPEGLEFHGNPWQRRWEHRNKVLELLGSDSDKSWTATEMSREVDCSLQTAQLILLELALEGLCHCEVTKEGYSKLFRINSEKMGKYMTKVKPKMTFDYREEEK